MCSVGFFFSTSSSSRFFFLLCEFALFFSMEFFFFFFSIVLLTQSHRLLRRASLQTTGAPQKLILFPWGKKSFLVLGLQRDGNVAFFHAKNRLPEAFLLSPQLVLVVAEFPHAPKVRNFSVCFDVFQGQECKDTPWDGASDRRCVFLGLSFFLSVSIAHKRVFVLEILLYFKRN